MKQSDLFTAIAEARDEWLAEFSGDGKNDVVYKVTEILDDKLENVLLRHIGLDRSWSNDWRVDEWHNGKKNPLYAAIEEHAKEITADIITKVPAVEFKLNSEEQKRLTEAARKCYAETYRANVLELIKERAEKDAEEAVENLVLEDVEIPTKAKARRAARPIIDWNDVSEAAEV